MCGINGIYAYHYAASAPDEQELCLTREAMHARGPDGEGFWWDSKRRCALAHRRLAILDLTERGAQPMVSEDGKLSVTFNGEIYNYPELRRELEAKGIRFRSSSDTEVLLHLYAKDGEEMVHRLRGMYAFAIWDETKQGLFLARDPYGIKPLYTANDGWTFRFASQVKALLAGGRLSAEYEPAGLVGFLLFGSVPEPFTLYRDVRLLPAGHTQWIDELGPREPECFFKLSECLLDGIQTKEEGFSFSESLRPALHDSVRAHLLSDVDVGLFLSSGVDSGALLGLMAEMGQQSTCAVTLSFDEFSGTDEDESILASQVAKRYGARHVIRRVTESEFQEDLPKIFAAMDQPSIDGVNTWFVAKAAREAGLKVALSGLGGDELLGGYPSFQDIPRWRRKFGLFSRVPGLGFGARWLLQAFASGFLERNPKASGIFNYSGSWEGAYLLRRALFLPDELQKILDPLLVRDGMRRLKPLKLLRDQITPDPGSDSARICALESAHYMRNQLLRDADWAGMAHSLEIRVPLVDIVLFKAMSSYIPNLKPGDGKLALCRAPTPTLPEAIEERPKTGFAIPTAHWLQRATGKNAAQMPSLSKGLASRKWSRVVLDEVRGSRDASLKRAA